MQYFKNFRSYKDKMVLEMNNAKTNDRLIASDTELEKDAPDLEKVLNKMFKVISKSETISDRDIKNHIEEIFDKFSNKLDKADQVVKDKILKDNRYTIFKNFADAVTKDQNDQAQKIAAEGAALLKKEEDEKKQQNDAQKKEVDDNSKNVEKTVDGEKFKNLFQGTKITATGAPVLSKTLVKTELSEVKGLQQFLADKGFLQTSEATVADGYFGDKTTAAVMAYQKSKGLKEDGIVGTQTWKEILKDVKFDTKPEFKAFQMNSEAPKKEDVKTTAVDPKEVENAKKLLTDAGITEATLKPMTIDKIAETLAAERMTAATVNSDEDVIYNTLIGQITNGVLNQTTIATLLQKYKDFNNEYKDERKNGLLSDLINVFDTDVNKINTTFQGQYDQLVKDDVNVIKVKKSAFEQAGKTLTSINASALKYIIFPGFSQFFIPGDIVSAFRDDTKKNVAIFMAMIGVKNNTVNDELKKLKVNVDLANKIINYGTEPEKQQPATQSAQQKSATPQSAKPSVQKTAEQKPAEQTAPVAKTELIF